MASGNAIRFDDLILIGPGIYRSCGWKVVYVFDFPVVDGFDEAIAGTDNLPGFKFLKWMKLPPHDGGSDCERWDYCRWP